MSNLTSVFHHERLSSFCGQFIPILDLSEKFNICQICVQFPAKIKIYRIKQKLEQELLASKFEILNTYEIFDKIINSEKFHSLLNNNNLNSIILSLSSYKISIIEYIMKYDTLYL